MLLEIELKKYDVQKNKVNEREKKKKRGAKVEKEKIEKGGIIAKK